MTLPDDSQRPVDLTPSLPSSSPSSSLSPVPQAGPPPPPPSSSSSSSSSSSPPPPPAAPPPAAPRPAEPSLGPSEPQPTQPPYDPYHRPGFVPLRSDPPPHLFATWWLRYVLFVAQIVGIAVVLLREYAVPGGMADTFVIVPHVMAAAMLVGWSALAMLDAARLVPVSRYQQRSRAWVAVVLWLFAFAAPVGALVVVDRVRERFADANDDVVPIVIAAVTLLGCFVLVWLPFRYHARQAHRIGAPVSVILAWFWLPLVTLVGVLLVMALGLRATLAENGFADLERTVEVGVLYGLPALMFAMSTWRATSVFDEVIELRWLRWRNDWEQTLAAFSSQPPPGPEASPVIDGHGFDRR